MNPLLNPIHPLNNEQVILSIVEVRPYSTKELYTIYKVSDKTFSKWLVPFRKKLGIKRGRFYTVLQVERIFANLGIPYIIMQKEETKLTA